MSTQKHPKKSPARDWHRADIIAALRKAGWSLRRLSKHYGYASPTTLKNALCKPWPLAEERICDAIRRGGEHPALKPADIWPSRYLDGSKSTRRTRPVHVNNSRSN